MPLIPIPPIPTKCTRRFRPFTAVAPCGRSPGHPPQSTTPLPTPTTSAFVYRSMGGLFKGWRAFLRVRIRALPAPLPARVRSRGSAGSRARAGHHHIGRRVGTAHVGDERLDPTSQAEGSVAGTGLVGVRHPGLVRDRQSPRRRAEQAQRLEGRLVDATGTGAAAEDEETELTVGVR